MIIKGKLQKKQLAFRAILAFLVLLIILIIVGLARELVNHRKINDQIKSLQQQIGQTQSENLEINTLISSWESGSELEKKARSELGLKKAGEKVVLITKNSSDTAELPPVAINPDVLNPANDEDNQAVSNPAKWWQYFFK